MLNSKMFSLIITVVIISTGSTYAFADHMMADVQIAPDANKIGCELNNECYIPHQVTVDLGGEVTWTNDASSATTVTSGTADGGPDGLFNSGLIQPGDSFTFKFEEPGTYHYFSMIHPWMEGTVVVEEAMADEAMAGEEHMEGEMKMMGDSSLPPLKQVAEGIAPENVACKSGLELLIKSSTGSAACVSSASADELVERGWGTRA